MGQKPGHCRLLSEEPEMKVVVDSFQKVGAVVSDTVLCVESLERKGRKAKAGRR